MSAMKKIAGNPSKVRRGIASQYGMEKSMPIPPAKKAGQMRVPKVGLSKGSVKVPAMKNTYAKYNSSRKYN